MPRRAVLRFVINLFFLCTPLCLALSSCRTTNSQPHLKTANVRQVEADRAFAIIDEAMSFVPFEYSFTNCDARADYFQMLLAAQYIPSRVIYVRSPTITNRYRKKIYSSDGPFLKKDK
jgi:hypothetical protein